MKVLFYINVSNVDDPECDSGIIFARTLSNVLVEDGHEVGVILPADFRDNLLFPSAVAVQYGPTGTSRYHCRFAFDWDFFTRGVEDYKPDILFNNQAELAPAFRALLATLDEPRAVLATYCHYPAVIPDGTAVLTDPSLAHHELGEPIVASILHGVNISDLFITQSHFAADLLQKAAKARQISIRRPVHVLPPPLDPIITLPKTTLAAPTGRRVLYNHRLYESYGTPELLDFLTSHKSLKFDIMVSDPMPNRNPSRVRRNDTPGRLLHLFERYLGATIFSGGGARQSYAELISSARVALAPWRRACVWSMAVVDCLSLGIPVIAPAYAAFPEFVPPELLFRSPEEAKHLLERLLNDDSFWSACSASSRDATRNLEARHIGTMFANLFADTIVKVREATVCVAS